MFLRDACNQPVSLAWIGNICSRVTVEKWGWHHCSPVSPPSSGQCYCWSRYFFSPTPLPIHSRLCDDSNPHPAPYWHFVWPFAPPSEQRVKLNWTDRKAIKPQRSLCQSSVAFLFLLMAIWLEPFTPPTSPKPAAEISSRPAQARATFCWRVPFFVLSVTNVLFLMDFALHF